MSIVMKATDLPMRLDERHRLAELRAVLVRQIPPTIIVVVVSPGQPSFQVAQLRVVQAGHAIELVRVALAGPVQVVGVADRLLPGRQGVSQGDVVVDAVDASRSRGRECGAG